MFQQKTSKLTFVCGPMFAGKTSYVIHKIMENVIKKKNVLVITSILDNRYTDSTSSIRSHDTLCLDLNNPCIKHIQTDKLINTIDIILTSGIKNIFIDEVQFFPDIIDFCKRLESIPDVNVIMSGLDTDFKKEDFNGIEKIYKYCDKVKKMHATCNICKTNIAIYSKRLSSSDKLIDIGGDDKYISVCKLCYSL